MTRWGYKTVLFEMKKEGLLGGVFLDETEIEQELNEFGRSGWELVSLLEMQDGIIAFFKQPLGQRAVVVDDAPEVVEPSFSKERVSDLPEDRTVRRTDSSRDSSAGELQQRPERSSSGAADDNVIGAIKIE
ncbi:DUF4177 domain-containing protein [Desulfofustis glycolicus]|uniref:DUF4177 domain-containing protein n=1 Tax=Desulfofustis glycolicus DSM 9705 TaxID=1121409 RepID=A0A1M5W7E7_9BACT|nr:DUF4177 domain-containing protein [Desulfofustis glycolicus]MCB2217303.1 DUF4177 domain-containing protein [Desulfobulbaceae bacterium]SHH83400.1 hypothetical protein SAMN02745124_02126 [Desulfofustis glycolicus DSM 9705]